MALIQCRFFSETLTLSTSMTVILPERAAATAGSQNKKSGVGLPTLFLLHGYSDDDTTWVRRTSIERYVASLGLAVVMPQVHHSYYTDMAHGLKFWTFLSEELPLVARSFFPLSEAREDNFVAGLSMGGYGAMKWALRCPDRFAAAASLSGALNIASPAISVRPTHDFIFDGQETTGTEHDLLWLLEQRNREQGPKPKLYQCCGTEDFLYVDNIRFRDACRRTDFDLTYEEGQGTHEWGYWDAKIQDVLRWLPLATR